MNFTTVSFKPRVYICSFPKSGTNLASLFVRHIVKIPDDFEFQWLSATDAWTGDSIDPKDFAHNISLLQNGYFAVGHTGYNDEYAKVLQHYAVCVLFIYRDLRDVAVSQTYHIEDDDDERFAHPDKTVYADMTHQERLRAVIEGVPGYPGIGERWSIFKKWLDQEWVLSIRYEEMLAYPELVIDDILTYVLARGMVSHDYIPMVAKSNLEYVKEKTVELVERSTRKHSPTLRKGKAGGWREEFDDSTKRLFKRHAGDLLIEQGYELDNEW